jgi:hypothetical protein
MEATEFRRVDYVIELSLDVLAASSLEAVEFDGYVGTSLRGDRELPKMAS